MTTDSNEVFSDRSVVSARSNALYHPIPCWGRQIQLKVSDFRSYRQDWSPANSSLFVWRCFLYMAHGLILQPNTSVKQTAVLVCWHKCLVLKWNYSITRWVQVSLVSIADRYVSSEFFHSSQRHWHPVSKYIKRHILILTPVGNALLKS
jgi:hypothetical protein